MPAPLKPGDAFGEEVTLPERTIVYIEGAGAIGTRLSTRCSTPTSRSTNTLDKQGIKPAGPAMTIYTQTDDTGFKFRAA